MVFLVFALAVLLAAGLLYRCQPLAWYWHVLSLAVALAVGLVPGDMIPPSWRSQTVDVAIGFVFLFLIVWGVGGILFYGYHHERHA